MQYSVLSRVFIARGRNIDLTMKVSRIISTAVLTLACVAGMAQTKVVAHRGYWQTEGSAQNSIAALEGAKNLGCWGSEFDVWITTDGVCVVNHDATTGGMVIEESAYADLKNVTLKNGEHMPTLEEYLGRGSHLAPMELILEIKSHKSKDRENKCVDEVLRLVKKYGVVNNTSYISFSLNVCRQLIAKGPSALDGPNGQRSGKKVDKVNLQVAYLNGDLSPEEVKAEGFTGIDYEQDVLNKHPEWVEKCHELGLTVNVWTVNSLDAAWKFIASGVDFITTDRPVECLKLCK